MENKSMCLYCGNIVKSDDTICKCGGRKFVVGKNYTKEDTKINCNCGNDSFKLIQHLNIIDRDVCVHQCSKCTNCITIIRYKDESDF